MITCNYTNWFWLIELGYKRLHKAKLWAESS